VAGTAGSARPREDNRGPHGGRRLGEGAGRSHLGKSFGFHTMTAWADHGADGNGEPLAIVLRPGNAGSNHRRRSHRGGRLALAQLPRRLRGRALVRADSGGGTHEFLAWLAAGSRPLH
jgi:hypothetical protein